MALYPEFAVTTVDDRGCANERTFKSWAYAVGYYEAIKGKFDYSALYQFRAARGEWFREAYSLKETD